MKTRVLAVECPMCEDLIYSRSRHDFHRCSCGEIAVDGGFDYVRIIFNTVMPKRKFKFVNASRDELYQDWNKRKDVFGVIKKLTRKKRSRKV